MMLDYDRSALADCTTSSNVGILLAKSDKRKNSSYYVRYSLED